MAAHTAVATPRPPRPPALRGMTASHDPYRARRPVLRVPQVPDGAEPVDGPVTVLALVDRYPPHQNAGAEWYLHHCLRDSVDRGHQAVVATSTKAPYVFEGVEVVPRRDAQELAPHADVVVGHLLWTREVVTFASGNDLPLVYLSHNDHQVEHWEVGPGNVTVLVSNAVWVAEREREWVRRDRGRWASQPWSGPAAVVRPPVLTADYQLDRDPAGAEYVTLVNVYPEKGSATFYALARRSPQRRFLGVEGAYGQQVKPEKRDGNVAWQAQTARIRDDAYARTRVLLAPSIYESWSRASVEAMASGIPVIAHPTPGLRESLGDAGIFVDRDDIDGWLAALDLLDDPDTYTEASTAARKRATELDAQTRDDLDTWDRVLRLAAAAKPGRHR